MTPVERLQAAIAELQRLQADSTPGAWGPWTVITSDDETERVHVTGNSSGPSDGNIVATLAFTERLDDILIVTLHRTIDAQLVILQHALARAEAKIAGGGIAHAVWSHERDALTLADAILNRTPVDALVDEHPGLGHHVDRDKLRDHVATLFDVDPELLKPPPLAEDAAHE